MSTIQGSVSDMEAKPMQDGTPAVGTGSRVQRRGARAPEPLIFEKDAPGSQGVDLPPSDVPRAALPPELEGRGPVWPELGQLQVMRHYTHLSQRNFSIDGEFYPLGSCTMKYNPRINEWAAAQPGFAHAHPLSDASDVQGLLELIWTCERYLSEIAGLPHVSAQPAAGAHGEYTALKVIRAYLRDKGEGQRRIVLAPETAHGTNPASCAMCGAGVVQVGTVGGHTDLEDLHAKIEEHGAQNIAALMLTNPNTAGLFDGKITEISDIMHGIGALVYLDGANMNAILGKARPGDFGADVMHYNTHKTFSTPHGCGGPGWGPIAVSEALEPYLPVPRVVKHEDGTFGMDWGGEKSIGKVRSFFGQVGVIVRCYTYIRALGREGLVNVAEQAVVSANYLAARLAGVYELPFADPRDERYCAHEFVTVPTRLLSTGATLVDIAKRLIDYGIHPPTMHWPVQNCLMVEPTETESMAVLDRFADAMLAIAQEIERAPEALREAPEDAPVRRVDEVAAARKPQVVWDS